MHDQGGPHGVEVGDPHENIESSQELSTQAVVLTS
jgi:hypothetical protein